MRSVEALALTLPQGRAKVILEYAGCQEGLAPKTSQFARAQSFSDLQNAVLASFKSTSCRFGQEDRFVMSILLDENTDQAGIS